MSSVKCTWAILIVFYTFIVIEAVLQPQDEEFMTIYTADTFNWTHHPCRRPCFKDQEPAICRYVFVVERYSSMSKACYDCPFNRVDCFRPHCIPADGIQKSLYVVNRQMPGPTVEVCQNDIIVVEVRNQLLAESTSIHWHGFSQRGTPYMDGVPYVTQCPILPGQSFEYTFRATDAGTYFWHSHIGAQRVDGLFGAMIICPLSPRFGHLYDFDYHRMIVQDWTQKDGQGAFIHDYHRKGEQFPTTILVNGLGRYRKVSLNHESSFAPVAVFPVYTNKRHRFRLINAGAEDCPIEMSIDGHTMLVFNLDSNDVEPVEVDSITTWPGERVDFIVNANQWPDNYWIRYRGYGLCQSFENPRQGVHQVAILRYFEAPKKDPVAQIAYDIPEINSPCRRVLNPYQGGNEIPRSTNIDIPELLAMANDDISLREEPDKIVFIAFDFNQINNYEFHRKNLYGYEQIKKRYPQRVANTFQFNNISLKLLPFPLLSQRDEIQPGSLCNADNLPRDCYPDHCACPHVIQVALNSVVELVLIDEGRFTTVANHPLHLHGHFFRVVATEKLHGSVSVERVFNLMAEGKVNRTLSRAPIKDTMKAPSGGYTIVRFYADNPGYWFFHCHFEQHTNVGMALVIKVGEHWQMPPVPKGFPKCHNFVSSSTTPGAYENIHEY